MPATTDPTEMQKSSDTYGEEDINIATFDKAHKN
jgi:hypothetical protein